MLQLIESFTAADGGTVEIFKTRHTGPDYHIRYGLEVRNFETLEAARADFAHCIGHARDCAGAD